MRVNSAALLQARSPAPQQPKPTVTIREGSPGFVEGPKGWIVLRLQGHPANNRRRFWRYLGSLLG